MQSVRLVPLQVRINLWLACLSSPVSKARMHKSLSITPLFKSAAELPPLSEAKTCRKLAFQTSTGFCRKQLIRCMPGLTHATLCCLLNLTLVCLQWIWLQRVCLSIQAIAMAFVAAYLVRSIRTYRHLKCSLISGERKMCYHLVRVLTKVVDELTIWACQSKMLQANRLRT